MDRHWPAEHWLNKDKPTIDRHWLTKHWPNNSKPTLAFQILTSGSEIMAKCMILERLMFADHRQPVAGYCPGKLRLNFALSANDGPSSIRITLAIGGDII